MTSEIIKKMTQEERRNVLGELLGLFAGAIPAGGKSDNWLVPFISENVAPECSVVITKYPNLLFQPRKLVIFEMPQEQVEIQRVEHEQSKGVLWWKKNTKQVTIFEHKSIITIPRSIWRVQTILVGQLLQFPTCADIHGDAYGPDGTLTFSTVCAPNIGISLVVKNTYKTPAKFYGLVIGSHGRDEVAQ